MNKATKIISILLTFTTLFQFTVFADSNEKSKRANIKASEQELAQNVMDRLGIMNYSADNTDDIISRIDFSVYLGRLLQIDEYSETDITYYTDVPDDHYALACLDYLTQLGGFEGTGNSEFRPNDSISPIQAAKVIFNVLGYRTYADIMGGYPAAYNKLCEETKLLDGFSGCTDITRNEMTVILLRAGFINKLGIANSKTSSVTFNSEKGKCIFEDTWDIYDDSGVLKNSGLMTLDESIITGDGNTVFNGVSYDNNGIDTEEYLGRYVRIITQKADDADKIIYMVADEKYNSEKRIAAKDFVKYTDGSVQYYDNDTGKEKTAKIGKSATILLNGEIVKYDVETAMKISKGEIILIDNNRDNAADAVIINSYNSYVAGYTDVQNELIYDKKAGSAIVDIDKYESVKIHNDSGSEISLSEITAGSIITIRESSTMIDITLSTLSVSGIISGLGEDDGDYCFIIDGEKYIVDSYLTSNEAWFKDGSFIGKTGSEYIIYMDCFGYVTDLKSKSATDGLFGYLIKYFIDEEEDGNVRLKLYTSEGELATFDCADKVKIDGATRKSPAAIIAAIEAGDKELIFYRMNSDNKISYIDTSYRNPEKESKKTLQVSAEKERRVAQLENATLNGAIRPSGETIKFIVPEVKGSNDEKDYSIETGFGFSEDEAVICKSYVMDDDNIMCDAMIVYRQADYTPNFTLELAFVVNDISQILNSDDEPVYQVEGYQRGAKRVLTFAPDVMDKFENIASDAVITGIEDIEPGDILRVAVNDFNEIFAMQLFVDYSEGVDVMPKWGNKIPTNMGFVDVQMRMYCKRAKDGIAEFIYDKSDTAERYIGNMNGKMITVVDTSKKKDMVRSGTIEDVQQYDVLGNAALPMYIFMFRYSPRDIVIYK